MNEEPQRRQPLMLTRRVVLLGVLVFVSLGCLRIVIARFFPWPGITVSNFDRIRNGMTLAHVEWLLGERGRTSNCGCIEPDSPYRLWERGRVTIGVEFDRETKLVIWKAYAGPLPGPLDTLREMFFG